MLTTEYCEKKFKEIRITIENVPECSAKAEYVEHLERLREAYNKEFLRSLER